MYDFKGTEEKVLSFWRTNKIFEKSTAQRQKAKPFVFFEGPPTANGLPGIHHVLARAFKDIICRYKTMRGFFVLRKAGWDTHGLPVEIEIEKKLGFKNKKDIEEYGIAKFNQQAKESVWKYKKDWEEMTERMGYWVDMNDPYITYDSDYMESIWNILKEISDKQLLYFAHKVVPFCVRCGTPLSSHEVAQGYKKITDKSVYIKFKIKSNDKFPKNTYILAWTTTPWTLPGNVALAVGKDIDYVIAEKNGENFILARELVEKVLGSDASFKIRASSFKGSDLIGLEYEPLFDVPQLKSDKSYRVYPADFVSTEDGTGIVHTAVMYGEDDYKLGTEIGLPKFHTVEEDGKFNTAAGKELKGKYVKDEKTEELIISILDKKGLLFKTEGHEHDYPFCWRCGTPLLYYAKDSWFIKMSAVNKQLLENNEKINWVPEHIKEGRFGQWLKEGKDWAISRERYWGTPLPVWKCERCDNKTTVGSVKELEKMTVGSKNGYYLMRHGLTARNEDGNAIINTIPEKDNYHLTEEGKKQAEEALEGLKLEDIDIVFTSPFIRTKETAAIAGRVLHAEIVEDERLSEIKDGPTKEGKTSAVSDSIFVRKTKDDKPEGGESWNEVRARITDFMAELESKYKNKRILIISHGDPLWLLDAISEGVSQEKLIGGKEKLGWWPKAAEVKKINWRKIPRNETGELDLHRPFVDEVIIRCGKCRANMKKVPDLIDVWFDSGSMPYAQWHYPFENKNIFKKQFPADYISEAIDQTRGWFYTLLAISTLLEKGNPYKNVICLGHILDEKGQKMSKSKGNVISPTEAMEKVGADVVRWYLFTINSPGDSKAFAYKDVEDKLRGFVSTIQNCIRFYELYSSDNKSESEKQKLSLLDKWILSKYNRLVLEVSDGLDKYDITGSARAIEKFAVEDLSNWWLRRSRKRKESLQLLRELLLGLSELLAPFTPFLTEDIYHRLQGNREFPISNFQLPISVHLEDWPKVSKRAINDKLEEEMDKVKNIIASGLAIRKDKQLKVRQPLVSVTIKADKKFNSGLEGLIKEELNVKKIKYSNEINNEVELDTELTPELKAEGYVREMIRQIQDMRKEAKYRVDDEVYCQWHTENKELSDSINKWADEIKKETVLRDFVNQKSGGTYDVEKESELAPGKTIWIGIKK